MSEALEDFDRDHEADYVNGIMAALPARLRRYPALDLAAALRAAARHLEASAGRSFKDGDGA